MVKCKGTIANLPVQKTHTQQSTIHAKQDLLYIYNKLYLVCVLDVVFLLYIKLIPHRRLTALVRSMTFIGGLNQCSAIGNINLNSTFVIE